MNKKKQQKNNEGVKHKKCEHDYTDVNNTLVGIPKLNMVYPTVYHLQCKECGEIINVKSCEIRDLGVFIHKFFNTPR